MIELFPEGFEEIEAEGGLELAAYTNAGGEERLWQVFGPGRVEDVEAGWAEAWKRFHRPVQIGPLWIGPPWEAPARDRIAVVIDPGQAFGTGGHATTRLCLELLLGQERSSLLDLGCGSGVIAIAAAKLGFGPVFACDLDPLAVEAAKRNAVANGVDIDVRLLDALSDRLPETDVAVANITLEQAQAAAAVVAARRLIASGYLSSEQPEPSGWRHVERRRREGWAADVFERL